MAKQDQQPFSISNAVSFGFEKAKANLGFYVVLFLIVVVVYVVYFVLQTILVGQIGQDAGLIMGLANWILSSIVSLGIVTISLKIIDGKKPNYKDLWFNNWSLLFVFIVASLIRQIVVVIGFFLLIVPGIILSIKLQYIEYLIVDKKMGFEAINKSWEMTKGVKLKLFLFALVLGLINIAGVLLVVVGLFITVPLSMLASAYVYR